jgi:CheY-like chemotaxis protein
MQPIASRHGIKVELLQPEGLCFAKADRLRLKQVALNLISNSIKYSPPGGTVRIRIRPTGGQVRFEVQDEGQGIPEAKREHLFRPFERLGADENKIEGTGIGLNLCKGLVDAMHGMIGLESPPEGGSVFWVEIPSADSGEPAQRALHHAEASLQLETQGSPPDRTILYLDAPALDVHVMERILQDTAGYRLISAMQADIALELAREYQPQVILLDLDFPDGPLEALLKQMYSEDTLKNIPLIVVRNDQGDERIQRLPHLQLAGSISKPYSRAELTRALQVALGD